MTALAIISVQPHPLGGLAVRARYSCGHEQTCIFPNAPKRSSRQELRGWIFGSQQQDNLCSKCEREAKA